MFPVIARKRQRLRPATNVVKRVISLGNVLTAPTPDINQVANATAVAKLGTSRAHALKTPLGVEAVDTTIAEDFPRRLATLAVA